MERPIAFGDAQVLVGETFVHLPDNARSYHDVRSYEGLVKLSSTQWGVTIPGRKSVALISSFKLAYDLIEQMSFLLSREEIRLEIGWGEFAIRGVKDRGLLDLEFEEVALSGNMISTWRCSSGEFVVFLSMVLCRLEESMTRCGLNLYELLTSCSPSVD
jgi:hypothetical protein